MKLTILILSIICIAVCVHANYVQERYKKQNLALIYAFNRQRNKVWMYEHCYKITCKDNVKTN